MTNQNNAAQTVLTDDEIRCEIHNTIGFAFDPGELQTVNGDDLLRVAHALLSKLRAPKPLGDSCHHCGWTDWLSQDGKAYCQACGKPHGSVPAEGLPNLPELLRENADLDEAEGGNPQVCALERDAADEIERLRREVAKLRAPVADERAAFEAEYVHHCGMRLEDYDFDYNPATNRYRDDCEQSAWWGWHTGRAALASAPVSGEAQPVGRVRHFNYAGVARNGFSQEAVLNDDAPSLPDGTLLYAAPQASAVAGEAQRPHLNIVLDHAADRLAEAGMREDASIVRGMKVPNDGSKMESINAAPQASEAALPKPIQHSPDDGPERGLWKDGWNDCVRHAEQLRAALKPQASEAVRDAERLEFLITHGAWVAWSKDHELCRVFHRDEDGDIEPFMGWHRSALAASLTARDAIDKAMAALSAQPGAQKNGGSDAD